MGGGPEGFQDTERRVFRYPLIPYFSDLLDLATQQLLHVSAGVYPEESFVIDDGKGTAFGYHMGVSVDDGNGVVRPKARFKAEMVGCIREIVLQAALGNYGRVERIFLDLGLYGSFRMGSVKGYLEAEFLGQERPGTLESDLTQVIEKWRNLVSSLSCQV